MPLRIALVTIAALAASPAAGTPGPASQPSASAQPDPLWQEVVLVVKQMVDEAHENGAPVKDEHGCLTQPTIGAGSIPNVVHSCPAHPGPKSESSCLRKS